MSLLSPWFLLGGLAIGLPLWLHLLDRENPVRQMFSSLMFFERRRQSSVKQRQLRYLLLLAMRLALCLLLALAFAKPVWELAAGAAIGDVPRLHLIVLDTSLSMTYGDRWTRAAGQAQAIVEAMKPADRGQILMLGPGARLGTEPTADRQELGAAIRAARPSASRAAYGDLAEAVRSLAPADGTPVVVHLLSDFQQSALPGRFSDLALPTTASLQVHNLSEAEAPNWTIENVKGTTHLWGQKSGRLEVTVAGFGTPKASKTVTFLLNGKPAGSYSVEIPAGGRASVVFEDFEVPTGVTKGEFVLEPGDDLPLDDIRRVVIDRSEPPPILFVYGDGRRRDLLYYRAALGASPRSRFRVQGVSRVQAEQSLPERFPMVVLSDIPRLADSFLARLTSFVENGGAVWIALGVKTTLAGTAAFYPAAIQQTVYTGREGQRFQFAGEFQESHPALQQWQRLRGVKFYRYAKLSTAPGDDVLVRLSDGSPLLIERRMGDGKIFIFASSFDNVWNDLPLHPVFVPFVVESARYLSGVEEGGRQATIDSVLDLGRRRGSSGAVQVFDPAGERALSLSESVAGTSVALSQLGFYEIRLPGASDLAAVNPDARESNLRPMDADMLALWQATGSNASAPASGEGEQSSIKPPPLRIWKFLLVLLVLAALVESVIGNLHLKVQREV